MLKALKQHKVFLLGLFMSALVIRILVLFLYLQYNENYWQIDTPSYHNIACSLAQGRGFVHPDGALNFLRLPGYPLFLAGCYWLFDSSPVVTLSIQTVFASLIPVLMFLLTLLLFPGRTRCAGIVGIYGTLHLGLVLYSGFLMSESLFLLFFLGFLYFFLPYVEPFFCRLHRMPMAIGPLFLAGVLLGVASMMRPVGHFLVIVALLLILFSWNHWKSVLKRIVILCFGWAIVISPWLLRNWLLTGYIFFHTLGGGHFLTLSATRVVMQERHWTYEESLDALRRELDDRVMEQQNIRGRPLQEIEVCYCGEQLSVEYFKRYPLTSIKIWIHDLTKTILGLYSSELIYLESGKQQEDFFAKDRTLLSCFIRYLHPRAHPWYIKIIIWLETLFYTFILLGLLFQFLGIVLHLIRHYRFPPIVSPWFRIMPFIVALILLAFVCGYARLRVPVEPLLVILSCIYWEKLVTQRKRKSL